MLYKTAARCVILAVLVSCWLAAQEKGSGDNSNTRGVRGVVTDASGNKIAKAVVQLKDTKSLQIRSFITEDDGSYHFAGLSTNVEYELKADYAGHSSSTKNLSVFDSKKTATINLKLKRN